MTEAEYKKQIAAEFSGSYSNALPVRGALAELAGYAFNALKWKGEKTAAEIAALEAPFNGDTYKVITTGGDLNAGGDAITTLVGDVVAYNAETGLWEFVVSGAAINV